MMQEMIFAQAMLLAGDLDRQQRELLRVLCNAAASSLKARLKEGITLENCREDFILAASLYALADLQLAQDCGDIREFKAGDLTVTRGNISGEGAAQNYQRQAEWLMKPYLQDSFAFLGV